MQMPERVHGKKNRNRRELSPKTKQGGNEVKHAPSADDLLRHMLMRQEREEEEATKIQDNEQQQKHQEKEDLQIPGGGSPIKR